MKAVIAWIFGLVFQFAVLVPDVAAVQPPCAAGPECCECCASPGSCPCAEGGEPDSPSPPLLADGGGSLKIPPSKPGDSRISPVALRNAPAASACTAGFRGEPVAGYTGVRLTVAYCSLLI